MNAQEALTELELEAWLQNHPAWSRVAGTIHRVYKFATFMDGIAYVNEAARYAETVNHHPAIRIDYRTVALSLTTHDANALTMLDLRAAVEFDRIFANKRNL